MVCEKRIMRYRIDLDGKKTYLYSDLNEAVKFAKENNLTIIDYKTGKTIFSKELMEAEEELRRRLLKGGWQSFIGGIKKNV